VSPKVRIRKQEPRGKRRVKRGKPIPKRFLNPCRLLDLFRRVTRNLEYAVAAGDVETARNWCRDLAFLTTQIPRGMRP